MPVGQKRKQSHGFSWRKKKDVAGADWESRRRVHCTEETWSAPTTGGTSGEKRASGKKIWGDRKGKKRFRQKVTKNEAQRIEKIGHQGGCREKKADKKAVGTSKKSRVNSRAALMLRGGGEEKKLSGGPRRKISKTEPVLGKKQEIRRRKNLGKGTSQNGRHWGKILACVKGISRWTSGFQRE